MSKIAQKKCYINERVFYMENEFIEFMINNRLSENTYKSYVSDIKIFKQYYVDSYGERMGKS